MCAGTKPPTCVRVLNRKEHELRRSLEEVALRLMAHMENAGRRGTRKSVGNDTVE